MAGVLRSVHRTWNALPALSKTEGQPVLEYENDMSFRISESNVGAVAYDDHAAQRAQERRQKHVCFYLF